MIRGVESGLSFQYLFEVTCKDLEAPKRTLPQMDPENRVRGALCPSWEQPRPVGSHS